jgi:hypothetical protein
LPDRPAENVSPSCAWIELKDKEIAAIDMIAANNAIIVNLCCCDIEIR